jgi:hypothetical protein
MRTPASTSRRATRIAGRCVNTIKKALLASDVKLARLPWSLSIVTKCPAQFGRQEVIRSWRIRYRFALTCAETAKPLRHCVFLGDRNRLDELTQAIVQAIAKELAKE